MAGEKAQAAGLQLRKVQAIIDRMFESEPGSNQLRLFVNVIDPTPLSNQDDFVQPVQMGLEAQVVDPNSFADAVLDGVVAVSTDTALHTFTNDGTATTIRGYIVCDNSGDAFLFGESFETPMLIENGQSLTIRLRLKERSQAF